AVRAGVQRRRPTGRCNRGATTAAGAWDAHFIDRAREGGNATHVAAIFRSSWPGGQRPARWTCWPGGQRPGPLDRRARGARPAGQAGRDRLAGPAGQAGSDRPAGPAGQAGSDRPAGPAGQAGGDWPDDLWPDDDGEEGSSSPTGDGARDGAGDGSPPGAAGAPPVPSGWPGTAPRNRRIRPAVLAMIIVAPAAARGGIAAAVVHAVSAPGATGFGAAGSGASGWNGPFSLSPGQSGGNGALPGGGVVPGGGQGAGPGQAGSLFLIGKVTGVSRTSITIGGPGRTVTAAVTGATRVTGKVSTITEIKVGDQVSAQITQGSSGNVAVAIAVPAQRPGGGSLP